MGGCQMFISLLALWAFACGDEVKSDSASSPSHRGFSRTIPKGNPKICLKENSKLIPFEVLPGIGWDNLRNKDAGRVIVYNYTLCKTTLDGRFLIPDDVETLPKKSSKVNTFAELISHYTDYTTVTARSINVHAGFSFASVSIGGSFSDSYQHCKSKQIGDKSVTTRVQLRYERYTARLRSKVQLHPDFKASLMEIAGSLDYNRSDEARYKCQLLVRDYGTHFLKTVDAGAVLVQEDQISSKFVNNKDTTKSEITVGASASFFGLFSFGMSYKTSSSASQTTKYQQQRSSSEILSFGGPKFKASNFTANDWADKVDENMVAIDRQGDPLQYLVTSANLPELTQIQIRRLSNAVKEAIELYYKYNTYRGCTDMESSNFSPAANVDDGTCKLTISTKTFGGVYQTCQVDRRSNNGDICSEYHMNQKNPLTGGYSCPGGYQSIKIHSATLSTPKPNPRCFMCSGFYLCCNNERYYRYKYSSATYSSYWCAGKANVVPEIPGYLFGGIFASQVINPLTQANNCPPNFYPRQLGTDFKVCISDDNELAKKYSIPFGGLFSCVSGNPLAMKTPEGRGLKSNPHSLKSFLQSTNIWPKRCPVGYSQHLAYVDQGCEISYCIKSGSLSDVGLPRIRRPPFINLPDESVRFTALDPASQKWVKIGNIKDSKKKPTQTGKSATKKLTTVSIVGISIGTMLFGCVVTVALIVGINVKRRSAKRRRESLLYRQNDHDYGTAW